MIFEDIGDEQDEDYVRRLELRNISARQLNKSWKPSEKKNKKKYLDMSNKVVLVLGAGARIGQSTALAFSSRGYRVAVAARSFEDGTFNEHGHLQLRLDLSNPAAVQNAFAKVKKAFNTAPSVVVYNGISIPLLEPSPCLCCRLAVLCTSARSHISPYSSPLAPDFTKDPTLTSPSRLPHRPSQNIPPRSRNP